ncbi:hypothetical protein JW752_05075 [Candidatus Peregrinibacteria bacterium]|nr:hypothetical protein [Candidatus Peregrinibacteria bacterium]
MRFYLKTITGGLLAAFVLAMAVWAVRAPFSAADVNVVSSGVYVTVCGDGVAEGAEECDDGKHCSNRVVCTMDTDCLGIGDESCITRSGDGCSATCIVETGSSKPSAPQYVIFTEIQARPEQRSGTTGTNFDTTYALSLYTPDDLNRELRYQYPTLLSTSTSGVSSVYIVPPTNVTAGNYDAVFKSKAHLSRVLDNVYLQLGENYLNFTNITNSPAVGSRTLVAGDISGAATMPGTMGDDVINSVDLSILLQQYGTPDPSGNNLRANLNQDSTVDSTDLNILLGNLDKVGDLKNP